MRPDISEFIDDYLAAYASSGARRPRKGMLALEIAEAYGCGDGNGYGNGHGDGYGDGHGDG